MDDEIRLRSACDRCHSQKLRCPKRQGEDVCDRCRKCGASCVYSPFRQKKEISGGELTAEATAGRSKGEQVNSTKVPCPYTKHNGNKRKRTVGLAEGTNASVEPDLSLPTHADERQRVDPLDLEWSRNSSDPFRGQTAESGFDLDLGTQVDLSQLDFNLHPFPNYTEKLDNLLRISSPPSFNPEYPMHDAFSGQNSGPGEPFCPSSSQLVLALQTPQLPVWNGCIEPNSQQRSLTQCIRQLSELSMSLFEHSKTIPPQSIHEPVPENEVYQETMNFRSQTYASYSTDETFRLTQELIDIYPSFIDLFTKRKVSHPQARGHTTEEALERLGPIAPSLSNPLHLDHASILLLLSCHLRLVDIYDELFKHSHVCIKQRGVPGTAAQAQFQMPQLRIGNYVPRSTTAVTMQMLMLFHFATSLSNYAIELDGHIQESEDGYATSESSRSDQGEDGVKALSLVSSKKVKERATAMLQQLAFLREVMLRDGHVA